MDDETLARWLIENGGPVVRYRAATELLDRPAGADAACLRRDLLASAPVREWLGRLGRPGGFNDFHGSRPGAFENVMAKLADLGLRAGTRALDAKVRPFQAWFRAAMRRPVGFGRFILALAAGALARAGYADAALRRFLAERLDALYRFARKGSYDVYAAPAPRPGMPRCWRDRPLVDPALCAGGAFPLPWIHDMLALAHWPGGRGGTAAARRKIAAVVRYVLDRRYQALEPGYGTVRLENGRYYAMGWSVHLPGYGGFAGPGFEPAALVRRVELMARFPAARAHRWFREALAHLDTFRTEQGTWRLPPEYLKASRAGYWVLGQVAGLGEDRRAGRGLETESTLHVLTIRRLAGLSRPRGPRPRRR